MEIGKSVRIAKEAVNKVLDMNLMDDGFIYDPSVSFYQKETYGVIVGCYLKYGDITKWAQSSTVDGLMEEIKKAKEKILKRKG